MLEEYIYYGNVSFTSEEIAVLDKAVADLKQSALTRGIYAFLEWRALQSGKFEFAQYHIDAYLESKGLKSSDMFIPPRMLAGGYTLVERYVKRGALFPVWWNRVDGAILYMHRWWGTTSPAEGWCEYAWFQVKSALEYEQVSKWAPLEKYMHKRRYWRGELEEHPLTGKLYRPMYSTISERGEIDLG